MKKKLLLLLLSAALLFCLCSGADALREYYINDGQSLGMSLSAAYAIGGDGSAATLGGGTLYALTASGLQSLEGDELEGGGGLRYTDGRVALSSERIRVGLYYYYSEKRDSSLESANLANAVGSGFAFGMIDSQRRFVPLTDEEGEPVKTAYTHITMVAGENGDIAVYETSSWELLYWFRSSGPDRALAVHPLEAEGVETLTWFKDRRYYGDFAYADLGNGKLTVSNILGMERYTLGVVLGEIGTSFHVGGKPAEQVPVGLRARLRDVSTGPRERVSEQVRLRSDQRRVLSGLPGLHGQRHPARGGGGHQQPVSDL